METEVQAYEGIGQQYFYLGDLKKSNYYLDRMTRGKIEKADSKVRGMYLSNLKDKNVFKEKNMVSFAQLNAINHKFANMKAVGNKIKSLSGITKLINIANVMKSKAPRGA